MNTENTIFFLLTKQAHTFSNIGHGFQTRTGPPDLTKLTMNQLKDRFFKHQELDITPKSVNRPVFRELDRVQTRFKSRSIFEKICSFLLTKQAHTFSIIGHGFQSQTGPARLG